MNYFANAQVPAKTPQDLSPLPPELELFARLEGLVGEEAALLALGHGQRGENQERRLAALSAELDRAWERLRERAERLAHDRKTGIRPSS